MKSGVIAVANKVSKVSKVVWGSGDKVLSG
jgi:hypothetical protein